jgi:Skp family chaperone for outer membrane proteins
MEAKEVLLDAEYERDNARTRRAKNAFQKRVDELDTKYKEIRATHDQLQVDYNMAKTASSKEEEITIFSLGAGDVLNVRELTGDVHFKEVDLKIRGKESTKNYKLHLMQYNLRDELLNINRRGRWVIVKFEQLA